MDLNYDELFLDFAGREQELQKVIRYNIYNPMYYRTDLVIHGHRVSWIIRELSPHAMQVFGTNYDSKKAELMGLVHDDAEIIMGDFQAGIKNKMSTEELSEVNQLEEKAIFVLAQRFPKQLGEYSYQELLQESFDHSSLESQVMQFADKFDALGEALHEVYAGNLRFMTNIENEYGTIALPIDTYLSYFHKFFDKFPPLKPLLNTRSEWFEPLPRQDLQSIVRSQKPHTIDSISKPTGYAPYDRWLKVNLKYATARQLSKLYLQTES